MSLLKIVLYLYTISFFVACGSGKSTTTSDLVLKTDYLSKDHNQTLPKEEIEIDFNQQMGKIRKELSSYSIKHYLSDDKQNAFIVATFGYGIILYHYNLSQVDPVQVNVIRDDLSLKRTDFVYFYPLKNGKMIYIMDYYYDIRIYVYDIESLENIGYLELIDDTQSFKLGSGLYKSADAVVFNLEEKFFTIDNDIKIDISDLYNIKEIR